MNTYKLQNPLTHLQCHLQCYQKIGQITQKSNILEIIPISSGVLNSNNANLRTLTLIKAIRLKIYQSFPHNLSP
jgi:hypothetical protein